MCTKNKGRSLPKKIFQEHSEKSIVMNYPINEKDFIDRCMKVINNPGAGDRELLQAIARSINGAYAAGFEAGMKQAEVTR